MKQKEKVLTRKLVIKFGLIDLDVITSDMIDGYTSIGEFAFYDCSSLASITIPDSVTSIEAYAFCRCSSITSISIPDSVTSIGERAFANCSSLPIEDNMRYADTYLVEAVDKSLSTYTIKAGTKWIGLGAFGYCSSLTSITIPNSVTSIGEEAFSGCSALTQITCLAQTPPTCGTDCFRSVSRTIPLYVPAESVEAYKAAAVWQEFNIVAESDAPTAIKNALNTDTKGVQKLLRDGQVLILRNGETYDMMGQTL